MPHKQAYPLPAKAPPGHPLFDIIAAAYRIFAYPKPDNVEVCTKCCMEAHIAADFFNPAIEELPLEYIQDWYSAAYDPKGITKGTWGYLLPRVMELLAAEQDISPVGIELSLNRFDTGNPDNWSGEEWSVLDEFQRMLTMHKLAYSSDPLDDVLCMFRLAGWSLTDLLDQIRSFPDADLAQRLWYDWCYGRAPGQESMWFTAFWRTPDKKTVHDFFVSPELYNRMETLALADGTTSELAAKASAVADLIEVSAY